ncbi:hypothetical protein P0E69_06880 [Chimaeribacter arupi]|uniref:hypothetical protein n=1 Tax=Chimaeribacter arupi TaxID=2060066 RepID=UPI002712149C|nr:hypothetical protein [Chimaeribacter arupi]WKZ93613.1 hypothetical protein P0E69_06880 [Chimaeribacter arupi]
MSEVTKAIGGVIGGVGSLVGLGKTGATTINTPASVNTDDALAQADDQLRRRQRKGVNANLLTGSGGDSSSSSTGQKTLLGG